MEELNSYLSKMRLMYKPPGKEEHMLITEYLNEVEERLRRLEDASTSSTRDD
jgi:hypothetical protein